MSEVVFAAHRWATNAHLIADAARLGYLPGRVLDTTYGSAGGFWKVWRPDELTTSDLYAPADHRWDFRALPLRDGAFDTVVFDPPYKLNGTPALGEMDERFGVQRPMRRAERMDDIRLGALECFRVCSQRLLVKCQDQVEGGIVRWQTDMVSTAITAAGGRKVDCLHLLTLPRPQPGGRRQLTARRNYSTLLVFAR